METKVTISNNWRNKINIKHMFTDDKETPPELIIQLCDSLVKQLTRIKEKEEKGNLTEDYKSHIDNGLFEVIDHFEFLSNLANGAIPDSTSEHKIPKEEWDFNYGFDGNFQQWFNDYMDELYDLGDTRVDTINNVREKLIWIG